MKKIVTLTNLFAGIFIICDTMLISACSSNPITQEKKYSWDAYQYNLSESQVESINQNLPDTPLKEQSTKPTTYLITNKDYWEFLDKISNNNFFSSYQYDFTQCDRESSGILIKKESEEIQECSTIYYQGKEPLKITATQLQNQTISLTLSESGNTQQLNYDTSKYFLFIYQKLLAGNRLLIIAPNQLGRGWNYYQNTPQATKH